MKLYGYPLSGNTHRVQALLSVLGVEYENVLVDLRAGAHKAPEYLALNPLGQVPVLVDNDVTLRDSSAIMIYVARTFDKANRWLPADPVGAARVQEWLSIAVNEIQNGPFVVRAVKLFGSPQDAQAAKARSEALFQVLFEPHLAQRKWLAGDQATIADLACYGYVAQITEGDFSLEPYPAIRGWLARVEGLKDFTLMVKVADLTAAGA